MAVGDASRNASESLLSRGVLLSEATHPAAVTPELISGSCPHPSGAVIASKTSATDGEC